MINWGIIGCGDVTELKSGPAFNKINGSSLHAVMRRNAEKAADYAKRHHVKKWYDNAEALIKKSVTLGSLCPWPFSVSWATRQSGTRPSSLLSRSALTYAASVVMFYVFARYRFPMVPFLVLLAAAGLAGAGSYFQGISPARGAVAIASIASAALLANWPLLSII